MVSVVVNNSTQCVVVGIDTTLVTPTAAIYNCDVILGGFVCKIRKYYVHCKSRPVCVSSMYRKISNRICYHFHSLIIFSFCVRKNALKKH